MPNLGFDEKSGAKGEADPREKERENEKPRGGHVKYGVRCLGVWTLSGIGVGTVEAAVVRGGLNMLRTSLASCRVVDRSYTAHMSVSSLPQSRYHDTVLRCCCREAFWD